MTWARHLLKGKHHSDHGELDDVGRSKIMKLQAAAVLVCGLGLLAATEASGTELIQNGGFETGNLSGWNSTINVGVANSYLGVNPHSGNYMAVMSPLGFLDSYLGQSVSLSGYSSAKVSFAYNLGALDISRYLDIGTDRLAAFIGTQEIWSFSLNDLWDRDGNPTLTGWQTADVTVDPSLLGLGTVQFGFVLLNENLIGGDIGQNLVALIDDVSVDGESAGAGSPVPDAGSTLALFGAALSGLGLLKRKFSRI
jgi:hypothetical protein